MPTFEDCEAYAPQTYDKECDRKGGPETCGTEPRCHYAKSGDCYQTLAGDWFPRYPLVSDDCITPTTAAPTTLAPTTPAPTTVAPTTPVPTTTAPTTAAPTTPPPAGRCCDDVHCDTWPCPGGIGDCGGSTLDWPCFMNIRNPGDCGMDYNCHMVLLDCVEGMCCYGLVSDTCE